MTTLHITRHLLEQIQLAAVYADGRECMGLLASPAGSTVITEMRLLPAVVSASSAEAAPMAIKRCAEELTTHSLVPRGLFHSHGHFGVFHSSTDQSTLGRLLPAMAAWSFKRLPARVLAPTVTGPDEAVLPMADGHVLTFMLLGPPIPGVEANERAAWTSIHTHFVETSPQEPQARHTAIHLHLEGGGMAVTLAVPEGASISCRKEDFAPLRVACLYSLVVNSRGEACAEALFVYDIDGQCLTQQEACEIKMVEDLGRGTGQEEMDDPLPVGREASRFPATGQLRRLLARVGF